MGATDRKRIGVLVGAETAWPEAFMRVVNEHSDKVSAELVMLGGTFMDEECPYQCIVDRISHDLPYYRLYAKFAAMQGCHVINDPMTWSMDSKFVSISLIKRLGLQIPRTMALPNKDCVAETTPATFRNLTYPMDWQGIIDYVGVPAIFKDVSSGGRSFAHRVHSVEELIQRYDESGTRTMILQELIDSDSHIHCLVIGESSILTLNYSLSQQRYLEQVPPALARLKPAVEQSARAITDSYGYEVNLVEFIARDGQLYVINGTNPAPVIDPDLMGAENFHWCVREIANLAINRASSPRPPSFPSPTQKA